MKRWLKILLVILPFWGNVANAQHITPNSSKKEVKAFLKNKGGDQVEYCIAHEDVYFVRNKKTGKWGMYDWYGMLLPMEFDTIQHFDQFQPFTVGKKEGQNVVIQWPYDTESEGVEMVNGVDSLLTKQFKSRGISSASYFLLASKNGKWGCLDWATLVELIPFEYSSPEEVPIETLYRSR